MRASGSNFQLEINSQGQSHSHALMRPSGEAVDATRRFMPTENKMISRTSVLNVSLCFCQKVVKFKQRSKVLFYQKKISDTFFNNAALICAASPCGLLCSVGYQRDETFNLIEFRLCVTVRTTHYSRHKDKLEFIEFSGSKMNSIECRLQ